MDKWITRQQVDLAAASIRNLPFAPSVVRGSAASMVWEVTVTLDGRPADLKGAVISAEIVRPDGSTVLLTGEKQDNVARVTFDDACCNFVGTLRGVMWATDGSKEMVAIAWAQWEVRRGGTDVIVDPGAVVPSLPALLAEIENMRAATADANSAAQDAKRISARLDAMLDEITIQPTASGSLIRAEDSASCQIQRMTVYGKTRQKKVPSPGEPAEIQALARDGRLAITACGKNLIPYPYKDSTKTLNGITYTDNGDGSVKVTGTATADSSFLLCEGIAFSQIFLRRTEPTDGIVCISGERTYYDPAHATTFIYVSSGVTVDFVCWPQMEFGQEPTAYERFSGQTANCAGLPALHAAPVSSGGNVIIDGQRYIADTLEVCADGTGKVVKRFAEATFSGDEGWAQNTGNPSVQQNRFVLHITGKTGAPDSTGAAVQSRAFCNRYISVSPNDLFNGATPTAFATFDKTQIGFRDETILDVSSWTARLREWASAGDPLKAVYLRLEPAVIELSAEQVDQIISLQTIKPATNLYATDTAAMDVTYVADPKAYIDTRIAALESAFLGLGG